MIHPKGLINLELLGDGENPIPLTMVVGIWRSFQKAIRGLNERMKLDR